MFWTGPLVNAAGGPSGSPGRDASSAEERRLAPRGVPESGWRLGAAGRLPLWCSRPGPSWAAGASGAEEASREPRRPGAVTSRERPRGRRLRVGREVPGHLLRHMGAQLLWPSWDFSSGGSLLLPRPTARGWCGASSSLSHRRAAHPAPGTASVAGSAELLLISAQREPSRARGPARSGLWHLGPWLRVLAAFSALAFSGGAAGAESPGGTNPSGPRSPSSPPENGIESPGKLHRGELDGRPGMVGAGSEAGSVSSARRGLIVHGLEGSSGPRESGPRSPAAASSTWVRVPSFAVGARVPRGLRDGRRGRLLQGAAAGSPRAAVQSPRERDP